MTVQQLFDLLTQQPQYLIAYFLLLPLIALIAGFMSSGEGHLSPWKYLFSLLIYLACVPGVFSITLNVYLFLFERRSIFQSDVYMQVLPIISMLITLLILRRFVNFTYIPGFDKISGLIMMIAAVIIFMWFIDRTHIYSITYIPFYQLIILFIVLLLVIRWGWSRLITPNS
ncbi:MAG: hypothetical protein KA974_05010 [Saprospiraceae bacterium]|nr:hypothetical protein [Saprospiraceae bacterium]MBP7699776.1 hypothetical protein [Saprospiraceae bacterium]